MAGLKAETQHSIQIVQWVDHPLLPPRLIGRKLDLKWSWDSVPGISA